MSKTVWKYELKETDAQVVSMPTGADLLHVAGQEIIEWTDRGTRRGMFPMLWALVDPTSPKVDRIIYITGTGNPPPGDSVIYTGRVRELKRPIDLYVGTAICGSLVWHVFDGGETA